MYCDLTSNEIFYAVCKVNAIKKHYKANSCYLHYFCAHSAIYVVGVPKMLFMCVQCYLCAYSTVYSFQSMKSPVELNSPISKFFCYIA